MSLKKYLLTEMLEIQAMKNQRRRNQGQAIFEYFILFVLIATMSIVVSSNKFSSGFKKQMDAFMGKAMNATEQKGIDVPANGMQQTPWADGDLSPDDDGRTDPGSWW
jgi:hypothetical protein